MSEALTYYRLYFAKRQRNIPDPAHGSFTFNCFQTNLTSNSLRLQSHAAMFGVAQKFN
jgi:hypothetical protein